MSALRSYFSFKGRIPRKNWWIKWLSFLAVQYALTKIFRSIPESNYENWDTLILFIIIIEFILFTWVNFAIHTKRYHDLNKKGTFCLIIFVPVIGGIWIIIELGFMVGTIGLNRFGDDPIENNIHSGTKKILI